VRICARQVQVCARLGQVCARPCAFVRALGRYNGPKTALALSKTRFFAAAPGNSKILSPKTPVFGNLGNLRERKFFKFSLNFSEFFVFMTRLRFDSGG